MKTHKFIFIAGLAIAVTPAFSQQILTRADLNSYLAGGTSYTDNFEANVGLPAGTSPNESLVILPTATLDSNTTFTDSHGSTWGPGLVGTGASYYAGAKGFIDWFANNYFSFSTQTIGSTGSTVLTINYTTPVQAMGVDLMNYQGYTNPYTLDVFNGTTLVGSISGTLTSPVSIFNGWKNAGGITSVVLTNTGNASWAPFIDNSEYGNTQAVPEPSSLALLGMAGLGLLFKRRR